MQRYHDTARDPMPVRSPYHEQERQRLEQLTEDFLAKGGAINQVGHQMKDELLPFVINPAKTPVYAHLYVQPEAEPPRAKALSQPIIVLAKPEAKVEQLQPSPAEQQIAPEMTVAQRAARLMVQAALGASPGAAALAVGITEKQARQIARDYHITFKRQR